MAKKTTKNETPRMRTMRARFRANGATLVVTARQGKTGFLVGASFRPESKGKAVSGARNVFTDEARARADFDRLRQEALGKGWVESVAVGGNAFSELPTPPAVPAAKGGRR